ncbi:MAG: glycosyltransferase family 2 protein [Herbinix sp.]|nr:glycosyltransferase family 2 protein [Herbinix sp.]
MNNCLYIVIPCFNEQEVLPETSVQLKKKIETLISTGKIHQNSRIVLVNDGSNDSTWDIISNLYVKDKLFCGISLSNNRGHQNALMAGILTAKEYADMVITMDSDLQDDINAIDEMIDKYLEGCDIVYGVRNLRKKDSFFKRVSAETFYRLMNLLGVRTVFNHADYRLMSKRTIEGLEQFGEVNLFLRGIIPMIGYRTDTVTYERGKRYAGVSKYTLKKMLTFAFEGITSFSVKPIRMISALGIAIFTFSIVMLIYIFTRYLTGHTIVGWASVAVSVWAIGGLVLLSLGVVGEYIGKIYLETKKRPRYFIESFLHDTNNTQECDKSN